MIGNYRRVTGLKLHIWDRTIGVFLRSQGDGIALRTYPGISPKNYPISRI